MDVLPLYKTRNEVAALRDSEEVNEVVAVLRGGTTRLGEALLGFQNFTDRRTALASAKRESCCGLL